MIPKKPYTKIVPSLNCVSCGKPTQKRLMVGISPNNILLQRKEFSICDDCKENRKLKISHLTKKAFKKWKEPKEENPHKK